MGQSGPNQTRRSTVNCLNIVKRRTTPRSLFCPILGHEQPGMVATPSILDSKLVQVRMSGVLQKKLTVTEHK